MKAYPVFEPSALSRSPITITKVQMVTKPIAPLMAAVHIMASGNVLDASRSSSLMWVAESGPMKLKTGDSIPTRQERPMLPHWPPSVKLKNTSEAGLGMSPRTHRGTRIAKKPTICRTSTMPSRIGSLETKKVLKRIEKVRTAQIISVPSQALGA